MTPTSDFASHPARSSRWLGFGRLLAAAYRPVARPVLHPVVPLHPKEARVLRLAGRLHRLLAWLMRPLPTAGGNAADAATRLEILTRGGFPR